MPKLSQILSAHQKQMPPQALRKNLGDGFLMKFNPVFRAVRRAALRAGYKFCSERFYDYDVLALTQLPKLLKHKTIPYRDNVSPLREIEKRAPSAFQFADLPKLQPNHLFHESAHGVARALTQAHLKVPKTERELALRLLLEESFANACESLANAFASTPIHDEFLYKNSYIMEKDGTRAALRNAIVRFGVENVFKLLVFSFLHANLIQTTTASKNLPRVLSLIFNQKLTSVDQKLAAVVFKVGFDLDQRFTIFTNAFCLRLEGIRTDLFDLLSFDVLEIFEADPQYLKCLVAMTNEISFKK